MYHVVQFNVHFALMSYFFIYFIKLLLSLFHNFGTYIFCRNFMVFVYCSFKPL